jgi:hypothetical protein
VGEVRDLGPDPALATVDLVRESDGGQEALSERGSGIRHSTIYADRAVGVVNGL